MTENPPTYQTLIDQKSSGTRIAYPGSHLECLVEALDTLKTEAPKAYKEYEVIHRSIEEVLFGEVSPSQLIIWLTRR